MQGTILDVIIPTNRDRSATAGQRAEINRTAGLPVLVITTCKSGSAAFNRNIGLNASMSDPLIMVDDDVEQFPPGWARQLVDVLHSHPSCVMVSAQLSRLDGRAGPMTGGCPVRRDGVSEAVRKHLPAACVAIRRNTLRFDERYVGSGYEDTDYCMQLRQHYPDAEFLVCHAVWVVHRNEVKNQLGENWQRNKALFEFKWGRGKA